MPAEEINALRLTGKDPFIFKDPYVIGQDERLFFADLCGDKLKSLHDYDVYRNQRDLGGDFIPAYERQMQSLETALIKKTTAIGMDREDARRLLADALGIPKVLGREQQQAVSQHQEKGRGR